MLDPEIQRLVQTKLNAAIRERASALRADVAKAVAELTSRGTLRSSMSVDRLSSLCAAEVRRRGDLAWQTTQEALRAAEIPYSDSLPGDIRQVLVRKMSADTGIFILAMRNGNGMAEPAAPSYETDELTGLYRRGVFDQRGPELIERLTKSALPLSFLMLDLDRFKSVNDSYGHQVGDEALRIVAKILIRAVESKGEAYRYGGEELAAYLPNFSSDEAIAVAERIRREVEASTVPETAPGVAYIDVPRQREAYRHMVKQKLELTWVGKDERPRLEPRVIPDDALSRTNDFTFAVSQAHRF